MSEEWGQSIYDRMMRSFDSSRREQRTSSSSMRLQHSSSSQERRSSSNRESRSSDTRLTGTQSQISDKSRRGGGEGDSKASEQSRPSRSWASGHKRAISKTSLIQTSGEHERGAQGSISGSDSRQQNRSSSTQQGQNSNQSSNSQPTKRFAGCFGRCRSSRQQLSQPRAVPTQWRSRSLQIAANPGKNV